MAQKVEVLLVDDIDGGEADETVSFSLDGTSYEIDLSKKNAAKLRNGLEPFWAARARRARPNRRQPRVAYRGQPRALRRDSRVGEEPRHQGQ